MQSILNRGVGVLLRSASKPIGTSSYILLETCLAPTSLVGANKCGSLRSFSTKLGSTPTASKQPEKSVFISQSADIYTNLALEDWLYRNFNFEQHQVLLLWRNDPCVVIGRHQNPWAEVDVNLAEESKIPIARRNSGGGCVYHDRGNLNCTFFTPRAGYDRKKNLETICRALDRQYGIKAEISPRDDVTQDGYKFSGSAAKLGKSAFHHATVLIDTDLEKLSALLNPNTEGLDSKATKSVKSPVKNLRSVNGNVKIEDVLGAIGYEYLRTDVNGNDGGEELIQKQRGFQMVNPTDQWFPGLEGIRAELSGFEWTYSRTPNFAVCRRYGEIALRLQVVKGHILEAILEFPDGERLDKQSLLDAKCFISALNGRPFHMNILSTFEGLLFKRNSVSSTHKA